MSLRTRTSVSAILMVLLAGSAATSATSPSPSPGASSSLGALPSPGLEVQTPLAGELVPGRYVTELGAWTPVTFAYDIAAPGWVVQNGGQTISKWVDDSAREISWSVEILDSLFATPCGTDELMPLGPTVGDLMSGLHALPDLDVGAATDLVIDGRTGQLVELSLPDGLEEASCDPPIGIQVWLDQAGGKYLVLGESSTSRIYAVDVGGARFVLNANIARTADPADVAEFESIVESITFHP